MLDTTLIGYRFQRVLYTISGKPFSSIHIRNKPLRFWPAIHLPSLQEQAFPFLHIVILMQRKI